MNKSSGFTLIEVLVTIGIIGVLLSIVYVGFGAAREQARSSTLQAEMKEMQLALEIFKAQTGEYPDIATSRPNCFSDTAVVDAAQQGGENAGTQCAPLTNYMVGLTPEYIAALPLAEDSGNSDCIIWYQVADDRSFYKLSAENCMEGGVEIAPNTDFSLCPSTCSECGRGANPPTYNAAFTDSDLFKTSIAVYSNGGQCL